MNTRRLTKKYKHKSRSKKTRRSKRNGKTRRRGRSGRRGRRIMKGGVIPRGVVVRRSSARPIGFVVRKTSGRGSSIRPSARPNARPIGVVVRKTSGRGSSIRPSSSAVISKHGDNFNFHDFYNKLMNTHKHELHSTLQDNKYMYIKNTTFQTFKPKGAYPNMTGLKFLNYLHGKFNREHGKRKNHLRSIISQLDQNGMAPALRPHDLIRIEDNISSEYFELYKILYDEIYKKLFPYGNPRNHPLSTSVIVFEKLPTVVESEEEGMSLGNE